MCQWQGKNTVDFSWVRLQLIKNIAANNANELAAQ